MPARAREWGVWLLATAALFHRVLFEGAVVVGRDALRVSLPLYAEWAQRVRHGEFPQWFSGDAFGQSYIGMVVSAAFHPSHLLALILPAEWAVTLTVVACYPLAAAGTAALARRLGAEAPGALLAGATYGFCGYLQSMHDNPPFLLCAATAPWALAWVDMYLEQGRANAAAVACFAWVLCLFSGDAQGFIATGFGVVLLALHRRAPGRAAVVIACTALLAAPQALPAWLVGAETPRTELSLAEMGTWSTHPLRLVELLTGPVFFTQPGTAAGGVISRTLLGSPLGTLWAGSLALAPMAVVLAALAAWHHRRLRSTALLLAALGVALWLALGEHSGATQVLSNLPVLKSLRYPEKWMVWVSLTLALGAAHGITLRAALPLAAASVAVALAAFGTQLLPAEARTQALLDIGVSALVLAASALVVRRQALPALAGLAVIAALPGMGLLQLADPSVLDVSRGFTAQVPAGARMYRPMARVDGAYGDPALFATALVDVMEPVARSVEGTAAYLPAMTRRAWSLINTAEWLHARLYQLASVGCLSLADSDRWKVPGLSVIARAGRWHSSLGVDPAAVPRAYLAQPLCVSAPNAVTLAQTPFDRRHQALIECAGTFEPTDGEARWLDASPEHRIVEVDAKAAGAVVVTDAFASGWTATVDGADAPILPANVAFEAVLVPAGAHRVELRYRTPGLLAGALLFALGALALAALRLKR